MSVFRGGEAPPAWCELRNFEVLNIVDGQIVDQHRSQQKERLLATAGTTQLVLPDASVILKENQFIDIASAESWRLRGCSRTAQLVRLSGRWGRDVGGCGIFRAANQDDPKDGGDPVDYRKTTSIDSHYHDCDEYWIILEGDGTVVIGQRRFNVTVGDCIAIGMGHRHDLPTVTTAVKAAFFETTFGGNKRVGHLWNHTHGLAQPKPERV